MSTHSPSAHAEPDPKASHSAVPPLIEIRPSIIQGQGAFARCVIPPETKIIEYIGEQIDKTVSATRCEEGNPYIFSINDEWDIDGSVDWNPARFFNHGCAPNCEARQEGDEIWVWSLREIAPDEELTYNYGYDLSEWRDFPCACGAPNCVGFIVAEEFQDQVRRTLAEEAPPASPEMPQRQ